MATQTYRYRRVAPISQGKLRDEVGVTATLVTSDGGHIQDVSIDDATEDVVDLDEAMGLQGYLRIEDNPSTNPEDSFTPQGSSGGGGGFLAEYRFSTLTAAADPGNGRARFNTGVYSTVTELYFDDFADTPTFDMGLVFGTMNPGDRIVCQQNSDATRSAVYTIVSATDNTGWWTFVVTFEDDGGGSLIINNATTSFSFDSESTHIRHNLTATTDPGQNDDNTAGYEVGSLWVNVTSDEAFLNVDAATGAAIWPSITDSGGAGFPSYDFPAVKLTSSLTADWAVNGNAPVVEDSNNSGFSVRLSDDTTEEGFGFEITIPTGATNMQIYTLARAETTPGGAVVAKPLFYEREITDGAAVGSWSSSVALTDIDLAANEFFVEDVTDKTLASWGVDEGQTHQIQITRTSASDTLSGDLAWKLIRVRFT